MARKGDLTITDDTGTTTLTQGQETTRDDQSQDDKKKKKKRENTGASPAARGGIMDSPWAIGIGGGAILGATAWVLLQSGPPVSPSR
jgi:hypothetical protein